jgi:hypothetical protein
MRDDDEPKDWEINDEQPSEHLRRKWEQEELEELKAAHCSKCKQPLPGDAFRCFYCGEQVFHDSGLLGKIIKWLKGK